jgi:hypothetical protein
MLFNVFIHSQSNSFQNGNILEKGTHNNLPFSMFVEWNGGKEMSKGRSFQDPARDRNSNMQKVDYIFLTINKLLTGA